MARLYDGFDFLHQGVAVVRTIQRIAGVVFWFAFTSAAMAQQRGGPQTAKAPQPKSSSSAVERSSGSAASSRTVQTRTESGGREVVTETTEVPGTDGRFRASAETTTETVRAGSKSVQTKREVFGFDSEGRRKLIETTQADQQTLPDGTSRTVENTWTPDPSGRLGLSQRQVQEAKSAGPNVKQTDTTIYRPGINEALREAERVQQTERQVSSDLLQSESTRSVRDANGRWQPIETRNQEVRKTAATERLEEETVRRLDANGALTPAERKVTRRSGASGQERVVTETYSQNIGGMIRRPDNRLELDQRLRLTTVTTADGGRQTTQEREARNPVAPNDPLRVVERTVETVRPIGPDRWETQRQVFAADGNGRLVPIITEKGESTGK